MNPADLLFKEDLKSGLVTIASKSANGKTLLCNSIFYHLLSNDVNVIMFREANTMRLASKKLKFNSTGIVVDHFGFNPLEDIHRLNKVIQNNIAILGDKTAIIVDSPMFLTNSDFELFYEKLKENTRYVIFEKTDERLRYNVKRLQNRTQFEKTKQNINSLQELSMKFNMPIILTTQLKRIARINGSSLASEIIPALAFSSNMIITSEKTTDEPSKTYLLKVLKSRYSSENEIIPCKFDESSHSLVTI